MSSDISLVSNIANIEFTKFTLDELIEKRNQGVNTTTEKVTYSESGIPVIRANNISQGRIDFSDIVYVDQKTFSRIKEPCKPKKGDILYTNIGSQFGNAAIVSIDFQFAIAWNVLRLQPKENIYSDFLVYLLNNPNSKSYIRALNSSSTMPFVSGTAIGKVQFSVPNYKQQKGIARTLRIFDDRITLIRETNTTLEAIAQALFNSWFVDFDPVRAKQEGREPEGMNAETAALFPDSFEESELGLVPTGWSISPLYDLAKYINGAAYKAFEPNLERKGLPIIKIAELKAGITTQTGFSEVKMPLKYKISARDILFSWSGNPDTSIDTFVWSYGDAWLNQHIFRVVPNTNQERSFVLLTLKHMKSIFAEIARNKQTTGLGHVTVSDLKRLQIVRPPDLLLVSWNELVAPLLERAFLLEKQSQTLSTIRDTLLPRLISGQLRLPETGIISEDFME